MAKKTMYWVISKDKVKVVQVVGYESNGKVTVKTMQGEKLRILREDLMSKSEFFQQALNKVESARRQLNIAKDFTDEAETLLKAGIYAECMEEVNDEQ